MNNPTSKSSRLTRGVLGAALVLVLLPLLCPSASAQKAAVKTNIIHDATSTMNAGLEFKVAPRWTIDLSGDLNPWTFPGDRKFKHWLFQPEIRVWTCDAWAGHFFGLHALGGQFNVGGIDVDANFFGTDWSALKDRRYQGWMAGAGLGYGYSWILGRHWNIEAEAGAGWIRGWYDTFRCAGCGKKIAEGDTHDYFGVTKLSVNLVYLF